MVTWFSAEQVVGELQFFVGTADNYLQLSICEKFVPKTLFMILFLIGTLKTKIYDKHNSARLLLDETLYKFHVCHATRTVGTKDIGNCTCIEVNFFFEQVKINFTKIFVYHYFPYIFKKCIHIACVPTSSRFSHIIFFFFFFSLSNHPQRYHGGPYYWQYSCSL